MLLTALASLGEPFETDSQITVLLKFPFQSTIFFNYQYLLIPDRIQYLVWDPLKAKSLADVLVFNIYVLIFRLVL